MTREQLCDLCCRISKGDQWALTELEQSLSQEAVREEVLEEAAKIAEPKSGDPQNDWERGYWAAENTISRDIRALKREPNASQERCDHDVVGSHLREPNAAATDEMIKAAAFANAVSSPVPAAPDVAKMVKRLLAHGNHGASGKGILCEQAAALLAKLGQGWIPVSEKLPGFGITCLFVNDGAIEKGVRAPSGWVADDDIDGRPTLAVTHWMSLPIVPGASDD